MNDRFYGVPARNKTFVDRPDLLEQMKLALAKGSRSDGCNVLALCGLGGMGKTQLMIRYCYLHRAAYDFVFWLKVDTQSLAIDSFRKLAINLGFDPQLAKKEKDSDRTVVDLVRIWLEKRSNWLLLMDNADDSMATDVFGFMPRFGGDIILTTREFVPPSKAIILHVDKMNEGEALHLLLGDSASVQDTGRLGQAQRIVAELDCMPLAVNLARAYITDQLASLQEYLDILKGDHQALFSHHDEYSPDKYGHSLKTVWKLSYERLRNQDALAARILEICAFLHPDAVPVSFFNDRALP